MSIKRINEAIGEFLEPINFKKHFPNYVFGRPIFYIYLALATVMVLLLFQTYGYEQHTYFKCSSGLCETPSGDIVNAPYEEGIEPPYIVRHFGLVIFSLLPLVFLINHLAYNTRRINRK